MPGWVAQQSANVVASNKMELSTHCARIARTCSNMAFMHGVRLQLDESVGVLCRQHNLHFDARIPEQ